MRHRTLKSVTQAIAILFASSGLVDSELAGSERVNDRSLPAPGATAFEAFVGHRHSRIRLIHGSPTISAGTGWIRIKAIAVHNEVSHPQDRHGLEIAVSYSPPNRDFVYLSYESTLALRGRLAGLQETATRLREVSVPTVLGTDDCAPSLSDRRLHELCVGLYRRGDESGIVVSTWPRSSLYLPDYELQRLIDVIEENVEAIEQLF